MQSSESAVPIKLEENELWDPISQTGFLVKANTLRIRNSKGQQSFKPIPNYPQQKLDHGYSLQSIKPYLKFIRGDNAHVSINPAGLGLVCRSDRIQDVEMSHSICKGVDFFEIFCPNSCLSLSVGLRDKKTKKEQSFEFSIYGARKITFKIDLDEGYFKCWVNQITPTTKQPIKIQTDIEWTPFVRIKDRGTTVLLNPFINDPEGNISKYNIFGSVSKTGEVPCHQTKILEQSVVRGQQNQQKNFVLTRLNQNCLLLQNKGKDFRVIYRNCISQQFQFPNLTFETEHNQLTISLRFTKTEQKIIDTITAQLNNSGSIFDMIIQDGNQIIMRKSASQWIEWGRKVFACLDFQLRSIENTFGISQSHAMTVSKASIERVYEILLNKFQSVKSWLGQRALFNVASNFDRIITWGLERSIFSMPSSPFLVNQSVFLNSLPPIPISTGINFAKAGNRFALIQLKEKKGIMLLNLEGFPYKIGDFSLFKGIKKETELNQYKNQIEDIQENKFTQPSIYKILKNCLKYADKVKPPEKLVKQLEQKKKKKEQQKSQKNKTQSNSIVPDKSIENTLVSMGFSQVLSKRALIECKNASLEAAIDLILNKYKEEQVLNHDWQCQVCTLINTKTAVICSACSSPVPEFIENPVIIQQKKEEQEQKPEIEQPEQDVFSDEIEAKTLDFFLCETNIAISPILIACSFQGKLRFRLIGPNPKYYSNFYVKDDGFVDYSNFSVHEFAHQIDQSIVGFKHFLTMNKTQQKQNAYGWISIEDFDMAYNQKIFDLKFAGSKIDNKGVMKFKIHILHGQSAQRKVHTIPGKFNIQNVFNAKKRAFTLSTEISESKNYKIVDGKSKISEKLFIQNGEFVIQDKNAVKQIQRQNSEQIPLKGYLQLTLSRNLQGKAEKLDMISCQDAWNKEKVLSDKPFVPLVIEKGPTCSSLVYPSCPLSHSPAKNFIGTRPNCVVARNLHSLPMVIQSVVLERVGKFKSTKQVKIGYVYFSNDLSLEPLRKYRYEFNDDTKRIYVNISHPCQAKYLVIVPTNQINQEVKEAGNEQQVGSFEISFYGAIGTTLTDKTGAKCDIRTNVFNSEFDIKVLGNQKQAKEETKAIRVQTIVKSFAFDISVLTQTQIDQILREASRKNLPLDLTLRVSLTNVDHGSSNLTLKAFNSKNWFLTKKRSVFLADQPQIISKEKFNEILDQFLEKGQIQFLSTLLNQSYSQYYELLAYKDVSKFILNILSKCPNQKIQKAKMQLFLRLYGEIMAKNVDLKPNDILRKVIDDEGTTAYGMELTFQFLKKARCDAKLVAGEIEKIAKLIQQTRNSSYNDLRKDGNFSLCLQKSIFSDFYFNQLEKDQMVAVQSSKSKINSKFVVTKGNYHRKYVIDLMSYYSIEKLILIFDKSDYKSKMRIQLSQVNENGDQISKGQFYFSESVWSQISKVPFAPQIEKMFKNPIKCGLNTLTFALNNFKTRYLVIQMHFTLQPNAATKKEAQTIPQNEIIPQVFGQYEGQAEPVLGHHFSFNPKKLTFVKKIDSVTKFNAKNGKGQNCCYYDYEQLAETKQETIEQILEKIKTRKYKETQNSVKIMMKNSSKANLDYLYTLSCFLFDDLITRKDLNVGVQFLQSAISTLVNNQKGPISERAILLLKKLIKLSPENSQTALSYKFSSEQTFNNVYRQVSPASQNLLKLLNGNSKNLNLFTNISWLAKSKQNISTNLLEKLIDIAIESAKIKQIMFIFEKCGWINGVLRVLEILIGEKKQTLVKSILKSAKQNSELCSFAKSKVRSNFDVFCLVYNEITTPSRKIKPNQVQQVMNQIVSLIRQDIKDGRQFQNDINQKFMYLINLSNHFGAEKETATSIIETFFILPEKTTFLKDLFNSQILSKNQYYETLVIESCKLLNSDIKESQCENLSLVKDILVFTLRKQSDLQNSTELQNLKLNKTTTLSLIETLAFYNNKFLNIGGVNNLKLTNSDISIKVSLGFYISCLVWNQDAVFNAVDSETLKQLIKWLFVNVKVPEQANLRMASCIRFSKIQQKVSKIVKAQHEGKNSEVFASIFTEIFELQRNNIKLIKNKTLANLFERKAFFLTQRVLEEYSKINNCKIVDDLCKGNEMFKKILSKIIEIQNFQNLSQLSFKETQFSNKLSLRGVLQKDIPKDWLSLKAGSKKSLFTLQYPLNSTQQSYQMVFQASQLFTLSKILIGFQYNSIEASAMCIPRQIIVQGGSKLQKMQVLGRMQNVPDDFYINYSVRVLGFNCDQIKQKLGLVSSLNKNPEIKYLKLIIKPPQVICISDALGTVIPNTKNNTSGINFLSIQGYPLIRGASYVDSIVRTIQIFSRPQHKQLIESLFKEEQVVKLYNQSLINISFLMKMQNHQKVLHNFLMRVCEINTKIGNQMIDKYLNLNNSYLCAKIASQITLSNYEEIPSRVEKYFNFIIENFKSLNSKERTALIPFLQRFNQIAFIASDSKDKINGRINLQVPSEVIINFSKEAQKSENELKFLHTVMSIKEPFEVSGFDMNQILTILKQSKDSSNQTIFSSLIISNKQARSWFMNNNMLQAIYEETKKTIGKDDASVLTSNLKFLSALCHNSNIKNIINKSQYNLRIFELLTSSEHSKVLTADSNVELRQNFVNFIAKSAHGSENQRIIGAMLKDSLSSIMSEGNKKFVGEVFLPLLNSYGKASVSILPYTSQQRRLISDISNYELVKKQDEKPKAQPVKAINTPKYRLPTDMIAQKERQRIFSQISSKSETNGGNFNLIASQELNGGVGHNGQVLKSKIIKGNTSILIICKCKSYANEKPNKIFGVYFQRQEIDHSVGSLQLNWNSKSFIFVLEENFEPFFASLTQNEKFLEYFQSSPELDSSTYSGIDDQTLRIYYRGDLLGQISLTASWGYIIPSFLKGRFQNETDDEQVLSVQFWTFEPSNKQETNKGSEPTQMKLTKQFLQGCTNPSYFRKDFGADDIVRVLRYENTYEFPSSITVKELKQAIEILNCSIQQDKSQHLELKPLVKIQNFSDQMTLEQLLKKTENITQDAVIDFTLNFDKIIDVLDFSKEKPKSKAEFLPNKGILKHFSQNDGVTQMIKVMIKCIEGWTNAERREKWTQYVTELLSFSKFPHFFAMYLKDAQTVPLLFNILAGLPDKETDKKWDDLQTTSSQKLLKIVAQILRVDKSTQFRGYAMKNNFFSAILQRLRLLTGHSKRKWNEVINQQEVQVSPSKKDEPDDGTKKIKKKKGVGYGHDSNSSTKWMKGQDDPSKKQKFEIIQIILTMIENFLDIRDWDIPKEVTDIILESSLLPYLEDSLRAGTLLQISKYPQKFKLVFKLVRTLSKNKKLVPILLPISKNYQPNQTESIEALIVSLEKTATIFLSCLNQNSNKDDKNEKVSQQLAKDIIQTNKVISETIQEYKEQNNQGQDESAMKNILELPLDKKYRELLKDLRFDYIDMKQGSKIKHHYSSNFTPNYVPNQNKMIRLAQELADISTALPYEHTNAVFVRCDKDRVDFMQALIMGSNGTPYGHGAFLFDVYFEDNYPNVPPKVNLTTTGYGKIRFNPNLYACGKVCLSLLGTWRGSASENWDAKVSTLLQVLLSIQAIIMSQEVYFNEPGFQGQQGTEEGEKKNEAYSNIVRYGNVKFAMLQNLRNPPKGFETIIRRHFYCKKDQILDQCKKWILYASKRNANYIGLVNDHNSSWCTEFKKSKTQYKQMLQKAVKQLQQEIDKIPPPSIHDITSIKGDKKRKKKQNKKDRLKELQAQQNEQIDVTYQKKDQNKTQVGKQIDINDEKVKDRWSRYIGAMGIDAVSKQAKADILIFGLGPMSMEVTKNLVLSGCRKLSICDEGLVTHQDLSGGFFYTEQDVGKSRIDSIMYKLRQLNNYVKIDTVKKDKVNAELIKTYSLVLLTETDYEYQEKINQMCRSHNVKFISADCFGVFARLFNDFGDKFEVLDKNGEQPVEVIIKDITNEEHGVVTLIDGAKHPFQDGQAIIIKNVEGMSSIQDAEKSINGTIHIVKVINSKSFQIGSTLNYKKYVRSGTAKNIKTPVNIKFPSFKEMLQNSKENIKIQENLQFYDWVKIGNTKLIHFMFVALDKFRVSQKRFPEPWNLKDSDTFMQVFKTEWKQEIKDSEQRLIRLFAMSCRGNLPPMCAFLGGFVAQQIIKGITQKYKPVNSSFYCEFSEILPQVPENPKEWKQETMKNIIGTDLKHRDIGFQTVVGKDLLNVVRNSKLFMIGAGAIGCQLLKNFAMISLGTGEHGKITLTDPDHIENSNLNRQFLFRQKHISKPKSRTAAASILLMNPHLKNHISALLQRISESTKDIFSNKFFESLTIVANALDNVAARRYVDQRCVENKVPLFESGTLGPKGHVQVIIPYKTQSYGSQSDPVEDGEIPHCTLKMFPEQTLHCVEWARDIFGKKFSLMPKALLKILDKNYKPEKDDIKSLNESLVMVKKAPSTFDDCISYAITKFYKYFRDDISQLLYTYPLDAKTKNGQPFWKLPKRPPQPVKQFNPEDKLHCTFVMSLAVLIAKIYKVTYPKNFRSEKQLFAMGKQASKVKIADFVPSDEKAKQILKEIKETQQKKQKHQQQQKKQVEEQVVQESTDKDENALFEEVKKLVKGDFTVEAQQFQKDDDNNGHIDFIYAAANLRSMNYKLDPMDWITVKLKAGRIVPALSTTTTAVAGLQTLEICKYLKKVKINLMRNAYLNLAVPSLSMSEPGQVKKVKLTEKLEVNLWDRWEVSCKQDTTFGELYEQLKKSYGLIPIGVLQGMSRIDTAKSETDIEKFMKSKLLDKLDHDQDYIDIVVLFKKQGDEKILQGVPPVRLSFKK